MARSTLQKVLKMCLALVLIGSVRAHDTVGLKVDLDVSEVPHLGDWGSQASRLASEWYPRLCHLLASEARHQTIQIKIAKAEKGVAHAVGPKIWIASSWVEKQPHDLGLVVHELVHVVQGYPSGETLWLVEGIADYLRWAIYEGKHQQWFPKPKEPKAYLKGYRMCAGFLLWLESGMAPGIVKRLNRKLSAGEYQDRDFEHITGKSLDELWQLYQQARR